MAKLLVLVAACLAVELRSALGAGSGRAFPIDSENYITAKFRRINPEIEWDRTNFLVDLSGHYANCNAIGTRGTIRVDKLTPEGGPIIGGVDYTQGDRSDVEAVNDYIKRVVDRWTDTKQFNREITGSDTFGCSVRPGCSGQVSISCLFSNTKPDNIEIPPLDPSGKQDALAFTPQQYSLAEDITGNKWDRSHFLENLSGYETSCAMIETNDWPFAKAHDLSRNAGMRVVGTYGVARNQGSTQEALITVLKSIKVIRYAKKVGCSVIPDCIHNSDGGRSAMYVVVSCLYEEI